MKEIGVYIHIPFCIKKCNYCDFCSVKAEEAMVKEYGLALVKEIESWKGKIENYQVKSIFFGGGTPSIVPIEVMDKIIKTLYKTLRIDGGIEFTIESNPGTLDYDKLSYYLSSGINRLSMGLQAWQEKLLKRLGRVHKNKEFVDNYLNARKLGFKNINVDLMFGLPDQTLDDWEETLVNTLDLNPDHISAYSLKIEEATPFGRWFNEGELILPSEEVDRTMYHKTRRYLSSKGYHQYELSNFAKDLKECVHNLIYWDNGEYLGFGAGAHSHMNNIRFSNGEDISSYMDSIKEAKDPKVFQHNNLLKEDMEETMFLGLRKTQGISTEDFAKRYGRSPMVIYPSQLKKLKSQGLLRIEKGYIFLTEKGYDLSNQVFTEFLLDE